MGKKREKIETIKSEIKGKNPQGRPTEYDEKLHPLLLKSLMAQGKNNMEIAEEMDISEKTFYNWLNVHDSFLQAKKQAKELMNDIVELNLYKRAIGYSNNKAVKIFQFQGEPVVIPFTEFLPPDVSAQTKWLAANKPEVYNEKTVMELTGKDGQPPVFQVTFVEPEKKEDKPNDGQ